MVAAPAPLPAAPWYVYTHGKQELGIHMQCQDLNFMFSLLKHTAVVYFTHHCNPSPNPLFLSNPKDALELVSGRGSSGCDILSICPQSAFPDSSSTPFPQCSHGLYVHISASSPPLLGPPRVVTTSSLFQERS